MTGILLIDASKTQLKIEKEALINAGYSICGDTDGLSEGMKLFMEKSPDVVILDTEFAEKDVLEFIDRIKKQRDETIVIIMTHERKMSLVIRAVRHGVEDYIAKPFGIEDFIQKVRAVYR